MSPARKSKKLIPTQPVRQTRTRSKLQDAPPLMKGLDDRGQPIDALAKDPENITYTEVLEKVRGNEGFTVKSSKTRKAGLRRDRSVFDDPKLAGRAGLGGWADWSGYTEEEASIYEASGYTSDPTKNKASPNSKGSSSNSTNSIPISSIIVNPISPSPTKNKAGSSNSTNSIPISSIIVNPISPSPTKNKASSNSSSSLSDISKSISIPSTIVNPISPSPIKNEASSNSNGISSDSTNSIPIPSTTVNPIPPSPARSRAESCSSSGSSDITNGKSSPRLSSSASPVNPRLPSLPDEAVTNDLPGSERSGDQVSKRARSNDEELDSKDESSCPPISPKETDKIGLLLLAAQEVASPACSSFSPDTSGPNGSSDQVRKRVRSDDGGDEDDCSVPDSKKQRSSGNDPFFYDTRRRSSASRDLTPRDEGTTPEQFTTVQTPRPSFADTLDYNPEPEIPDMYGSGVRPRLHYDWYEQFHNLGLDCTIVHGCRMGPYCHECHTKWHRDWARYFKVQEQIDIALEDPKTYQDADGNEIETSSNKFLQEIIDATPIPPKGGRVRIHPARMAKEKLLAKRRE
ncbi:hypothetical protein AK830_g6536 [Neonectria ditissima]|uniref:Uncharacterized protein n=1 Tax=Neonectria ditissima TaxID=78410 RepID=A0A0P7BG52_9HYPO|nr:hypothetical protein AK830_g6536 [Neonectria ditissima]